VIIRKRLQIETLLVLAMALGILGCEREVASKKRGGDPEELAKVEPPSSATSKKNASTNGDELDMEEIFPDWDGKSSFTDTKFKIIPVE
jgi:hypothetical protein